MATVTFPEASRPTVTKETFPPFVPDSVLPPRMATSVLARTPVDWPRSADDDSNGDPPTTMSPPRTGPGAVRSSTSPPSPDDDEELPDMSSREPPTHGDSPPWIKTPGAVPLSEVPDSRTTAPPPVSWFDAPPRMLIFPDRAKGDGPVAMLTHPVSASGDVPVVTRSPPDWPWPDSPVDMSKLPECCRRLPTLDLFVDTITKSGSFTAAGLQ